MPRSHLSKDHHRCKHNTISVDILASRDIIISAADMAAQCNVINAEWKRIRKKWCSYYHQKFIGRDKLPPCHYGSEQNILGSKPSIDVKMYSQVNSQSSQICSLGTGTIILGTVHPVHNSQNQVKNDNSNILDKPTTCVFTNNHLQCANEMNDVAAQNLAKITSCPVTRNVCHVMKGPIVGMPK